MKHSERTRELLIKHYQKYPSLQMADIFKYIHQSTFGCEHLVSSLQAATDYISAEYENTSLPEDAPLVEPLDGAYSRVYLTWLNQGLSAQTFGKLFFESAKTETDGKAEAENKLAVAHALASENSLPFPADAFEKAALQWQQNNYPAMHHSEAFRNTYHPAYRVIANKYIPFLPLFSALDNALQNNEHTVLAIEGGSASGKSTLSEMLHTIYDCTVLHMDDFFLRPEQRTPERFAEIGGNIDYERFENEVLTSLRKSEPICYRKFNCSTQTLSEAVTVTQKKLMVVEGVYALHPKFGQYYDHAVFLDISPELQRVRITKRNTPDMAKMFFEKWIPLENAYFENMQTKARCDLTITVQA